MNGLKFNELLNYQSQHDQFSFLGAGKVCTKQDIRSYGERTRDECANICRSDPMCMCMEYSEDGSGQCMTTTNMTAVSDDSAIAAGFVYNPLRNIPWNVARQYMTVPLKYDTTCEEVFAKSLTMHEADIVIVKNDGRMCRYHRNLWVENMPLDRDEGFALYSSSANFTLYNQNYDIRRFLTEDIVFTRNAPVMTVPIVRNILCSELFTPVPERIKYMAVVANGDSVPNLKCFYQSQNLALWLYDQELQGGEGFELYFQNWSPGPNDVFVLNLRRIF